MRTFIFSNVGAECEQLHHWWWRVYGGDDLPYNLSLLHENCHRQVHSQGSVVEMPASREGRS